jgi:ubiquinone/menaquinone biosynthesis C-methylase UbiE
MSQQSSSERTNFGQPDAQRHLSYAEYANHFDQMCELLPVYQENIEYLVKLIPTLNLPENPTICDLGAGTGNYICALSDTLPKAKYVHVDLDTNMNSFAEQKYRTKGLIDVEIVEDYIERVEFPEGTFDLIICVNALNTAAPQLAVLRQARRWLRPNGTMFIIDFGRKQRVLDWGWYIFTNTLRNHGVLRYIKAVVENREAVKQNRHAARDQKNGLMWTHTLREFKALVTQAGFSITTAKTCYRGYCDLVVATK